jgi:ribosome-associated toxin RatA of RatAB toxin-antitoxin module
VYKLVIGFSLWLLLPVSAYADDLSNAEKISQLQAGEILYEYTHMDESGGALQAKILIRASLEEIREILKGCGKAFVFVDGMEQCEILERSENHVLIHQVVDTGLLAPELDYSYEAKSRSKTQMSFKLIEGNLSIMQGGWQFEEVAEGVYATYEMRVRPGFPIPRFLVRMSLRRMIPDMLACIRGLLDGSEGPDQTKKDLKRCPGDYVQDER